ncbi:hypothetical protein PGT21_011298 [Puccinia graminis f. sp. tritici]|uniref:RING-type domain-containing protein n=1 Tax=Puccinia graminis f. sp. tritici TaxID=56615 RepID=A0A5B0Q2G0_PUCGR|nr:hypothetical protein PGT21_011298 [Puccinia graminis f. sp. tritici]KAA1124828.1 hypothetical protein PGTUg99_035625 [Puccinia graminis f. sp. tritici]
MAGHSLTPCTNPSSKPPARSTKNFKCLYCFQKGHTISRCHIVSYDQQKGLMRRIGSELWLSDNSPILLDPWRPIKDIVDTFSATQNHQSLVSPPPSTSFCYSFTSTAATEKSTMEDSEDLNKFTLSSAQTTEETNHQVVNNLPSLGSIGVKRLPLQQQDQLVRHFFRFDCEMAILCGAGTPVDRHIFVETKTKLTPEITEASRALLDLDPPRVRRFLTNLSNDRTELWVYSPFSQNREEGVSRLLERIEPIDPLTLELNHPTLATVACRFCDLTYYPHDVVIALPCDPAHHFHLMCIGLEMMQTPSCPVCDVPPLLCQR